MLVLSKQDIQTALPMRDAVEVMKMAFKQLCMDKATLPARVHIDIPEHNGTTLFMPAYLHEDKNMAIKIVSVFADNPGKNLPVINAVVLVIDAETGITHAILDGTCLTAIRTGAAAGAATDLLAREDASIAAIFGAGPQGRSQLEAVCAVRPIRQAWVFDIDREASQAFAGEMAQRTAVTIQVAGDPSEAVANADVICTATNSARPVFDDSDIRPGTHINAMGVYKRHMQEVPAATVKRAKVVVDSRQACMEEAGDLLVPMDQGIITREHIHAELGDVVAATKTGRTSEQEITLFKSVGIAVQDAAAASAVLTKAESLNLGFRIELG
ncbi:MAG: hypothetical protein GH155_04910 [Spirochaeta sp.]|nr:hypothetical protein [Spirochaeta sp.]